MNEQTLHFYQQTTKIKEHYINIAENYDDFWGYTPDFVSFVSQKIVQYLELNPRDLFVDIGCGTGLFTKQVRNIVNFVTPIICVDFCDNMLAKIPQTSDFQLNNIDAVEFASQPGEYNKILLQHLIHHISDKEQFIKNLSDRLLPGGKLLLVKLPALCDCKLEHPLFEAALKKYEELSSTRDVIGEIFEKLKLTRRKYIVDYRVSINKYRYIKMVKNCYMSTLFDLSKAEIEAGIKELEQKYSGETFIDFRERLVFIIGEKS